MNPQFDEEKEEELRRERWNQRMAEMKRQKEKREWLNQNIKKYASYGGVVLAAVCLLAIGTGIRMSHKDVEAKEQEVSIEQETSMEQIPDETIAKASYVEGVEATAEETTESSESEASQQMTETREETSSTEPTMETVDVSLPEEIQVGDVMFWPGYQAESTDATKTVYSEDVISEYAIVLDASNGTIIAQRDAKTIINPASMTKVLTVLVAAEHVTDLDDEFTITLEITDYAYVNDCSSVGFLDGETVTVRDLFYGTILPSGGDAAAALATYVAGSQEAFVDMMNAKLEELGLSETAHFTNCVGLYDEEHYCTVYDMAMIMKAAAENDLCREVLSARKYTTSATEQHPEGITISNWFLRRIEDKETGGEVLCAKTGFVNQSGSCAASYGISDTGIPYICVTAKSTSSWKCIYDHVALYSKYAK